MPSMYELLFKTSRTFALAIPLLPEPTRSTTCLAYLLFRIADTLEDAGSWPRVARLRALAQWGELLLDTTGGPARDKQARVIRDEWLARAPTRHSGYRDLIVAMPDVLAEVERLDEGSRRIVRAHALRTVQGMSETLERSDQAGNVRITDVEGLRAYCYVVAGIVGELLTELFVHDAPQLARVQDALVENQVAFGEGLQLVNILKDQSQDAEEGRLYLPSEALRPAIIDLARQDLRCARAYIDALVRGDAPPGFVAFTSLSHELAEKTLALLERHGPGAKVSRLEVMEAFARYQLLAGTSSSPTAEMPVAATTGK